MPCGMSFIMHTKEHMGSCPEYPHPSQLVHSELLTLQAVLEAIYLPVWELLRLWTMWK